ncbi:MAG TPA: hypothetical protein VD929_05100 [Caulobacteraceae bacterium]|nr:hypothetical protein [Caulobacteraceae bacterium]
MPKTPPPVPREQRSFADKAGKANVQGKDRERRDDVHDLQSSQPGDDVNLSQQGRHGNIHQNLTHQGRQQDR